MKLSVLFTLAFLVFGVVYAEGSDFNLCKSYGCKTIQAVSFNQQQWTQIQQIFKPPALSAWMEKQQIREAVALMERFGGDQTGTYQDKGGNYPGEDLPGQLDCIAESTNTLQFLVSLQQRGLLNWHQVTGKQKRTRWLIFDHWTALIRETGTDKLYAVDSWYRDNGEKPYIQKLSHWRRSDSFPELLNP